MDFLATEEEIVATTITIAILIDEDVMKYLQCLKIKSKLKVSVNWFV